MRSMRYLFGGIPQNLDDSLHYMVLNGFPDFVSIGMVVKPELEATDIYARFTWAFPEKNIEYNTYLFSCKANQNLETEAENGIMKRLKHTVSRIREFGIDVKYARLNFDHS